MSRPNWDCFVISERASSSFFTKITLSLIHFPASLLKATRLRASATILVAWTSIFYSWRQMITINSPVLMCVLSQGLRKMCDVNTFGCVTGERQCWRMMTKILNGELTFTSLKPLDLSTCSKEWVLHIDMPHIYFCQRGGSIYPGVCRYIILAMCECVCVCVGM